MPRKLVKHGSNSGYRAELDSGQTPCTRCHNAHLVYQTQYSRASKAAGIKFKGDQVIDHLYGSGTATVPSRPTDGPRTAPERPTADYTVSAEPSGIGPSSAADGRSGPSLADRIRGIVIGDEPQNDYVEDSEYPDYLSGTPIDPDPDPEDPDYSKVSEDSSDYVINAAGMAKIEDSLGTYLSIFGITIELIDPYCGPVLAANMDDIVKKWSKVIAKYPKAADMFMEGKGGTIMTWLAAIQATWPFLFALYEHHLSKTVQMQNGVIYRKNDNPHQQADPLQPQFNYTAG
jgi:hypothetical protein